MCICPLYRHLRGWSHFDIRCDRSATRSRCVGRQARKKGKLLKEALVKSGQGAGLLPTTLDRAEKVRPQFLSLRQPPERGQSCDK
jgi:hypothetical protein